MRPLTDEEIQELLKSFGGGFCKRNLAIFVLGCSTGFRIKELLSLKVGDVYNIEKKKFLPSIHVQKQNMKKKQSRQPVTYSVSIQKYLQDWIDDMDKDIKPDDPFFVSQKQENGIKHPICVRSAIRIFKNAFDAADIIDLKSVGTHSMRKTFAKKAYKATGNDLLKTKECLGHKSVDSTVRYLVTCTNEISNITSNLQII